jgi:hypothetical protein
LNKRCQEFELANPVENGTQLGVGPGTTVEGPVAWKGFEPLCVIAVHDESEDVRSFVLASGRDVPLLYFRAGQHVGVRLRIDVASVTRTYSLSSDSRADTWRRGRRARRPPAATSNGLARRRCAADDICAQPARSAVE